MPPPRLPPALRGYEFVEWIDASTGQVVSTDARFTPLRAEGASSWPATLAFIATFKSNTFNIAFDANEGERAPDSVTALFGNQLRLPTTAGSGTEGTTGMSREGYKFVGWNTKKNGTGTWFKDAELIDGDSVNHLVDGIDDIQDTIVTLYAQWEPLKYLVSFRPGADDATGSHGSSRAHLRRFGQAAHQQLRASGLRLCRLGRDSQRFECEIRRRGHGIQPLSRWSHLHALRGVDAQELQREL